MLACCRGIIIIIILLFSKYKLLYYVFFFKSKIRKTEKISKKTWKYVICLLKKNKIRDLH